MEVRIRLCGFCRQQRSFSFSSQLFYLDSKQTKTENGDHKLICLLMNWEPKSLAPASGQQTGPGSRVKVPRTTLAPRSPSPVFSTSQGPPL